LTATFLLRFHYPETYAACAAMYDHARSRFRYDDEDVIARSHSPEAERLYKAYRNAALALGVEIDPFDNDL
jgi:hypothetical protein